MFSLFVTDFEDYLLARNLYGVDISDHCSVNSLFFADDLVLFANSSIKMKKCLSALEDYCVENSLMVNRSKSKIMVFRNGGRLNNYCEFTFDQGPVEICSSYKYLGVVFTPSGGFRAAAEASVVSSNFAASGVRALITKSGMDSSGSRSTMFKAMVESVLLYGSEIWGLLQEDILERVQVRFMKSLYYLHSSTPGYVIRLEFGLKKLILDVFCRALRWFLKMEDMDGDRFPRLCLNRQREMLSAESAQFTWLNQLKGLFVRSDSTDLWEVLLNGNFQRVDYDRAVQRLSDWLMSQDVSHARHSSHCVLYRQVIDQERGVFVLSPRSLNASRTYYQLLCHNTKFQSIFALGQSHKFACEERCFLCNSGERDTILHFLFGCPAVAGFKPDLVRDACGSFSGSQLHCLASVLRTESVWVVDGMLKFVRDALRFRHFVRECMGE